MPYRKRSKVTRGAKVQVSVRDIEASRACKAGRHVLLDLTDNTVWVEGHTNKERRRQL